MGDPASWTRTGRLCSRIDVGRNLRRFSTTRSPSNRGVRCRCSSLGEPTLFHTSSTQFVTPAKWDTNSVQGCHHGIEVREEFCFAQQAVEQACVMPICSLTASETPPTIIAPRNCSRKLKRSTTCIEQAGNRPVVRSSTAQQRAGGTTFNSRSTIRRNRFPQLQPVSFTGRTKVSLTTPASAALPLATWRTT